MDVVRRDYRTQLRLQILYERVQFVDAPGRRHEQQIAPALGKKARKPFARFENATDEAHVTGLNHNATGNQSRVLDARNGHSHASVHSASLLGEPSAAAPLERLAPGARDTMLALMAVKPVPKPVESDDWFDEPVPFDESEEDYEQNWDDDELADEPETVAGEDDDDAETPLPVGELVQVAETDAGERAEATELDIGEMQLGFDDGGTSTDDQDQTGVSNDDLSAGLDAVAEWSGDESAEEGPDEPLDQDIDETALPQLDCGDDQELDALDVGQLQLPDEERLPAWAQVPWMRLTTPLVAVPMNGLCVQGGAVTAAGRGAVHMEAGATDAFAVQWLPLRHAPAAEIVGLHVQGTLKPKLFLMTASSLLVSDDAGATVTSSPIPEREAVRQFCAMHGVMAALTTAGSLLVSPTDEPSWEQVLCQSEVLAIGSDDDQLFAAVAAQDSVVIRRSDDGQQWTEEQPPAPPLRPDHTLLLATGFGILVVADSAGRVHVRRDGTWTSLAVPSELRALCVVEGPKGPVVMASVFIESEDRSYLLELETERAWVVGDLSPDVIVEATDDDGSESLGQAAAMAWDADRGWLWIAGRFGLAAWRPGVPT